MSQEWMVSGLRAVDSGLQLYWNVRKIVCNDKDTADSQGSGGEKTGQQTGQQGSLNSRGGPGAWHQGGPGAGRLPAISEENGGGSGWSSGWQPGK